MSTSFDPEIVVIYCGRSLADNSCFSEGIKDGPGFKARFTMIPCSSKIEVLNLVKLIEQGVDGIEVIACQERQCQFLLGSTRAENRIRYARKLLGEVGIGANRLGMVRKSNLSVEEVMALVEERANAVRTLGQNPMK